MDLLQTIEGMEKAGIRLRFEEGRLSIEVDADRPPGEELLAAIQRHKDALSMALAAPAPRENPVRCARPGGRMLMRKYSSEPARPPLAPGETESAQDGEPLDLSPRQLARWRRRRLRDAERGELAAMLAFGDPRAGRWR